MIAEKIAVNTREVLEHASASGCEPRLAAVKLAETRVGQAAEFRRWH
jgi:hypothetical protein